MVVLLSLMACGILAGYLLRRQKGFVRVANRLVTIAVYALLLTLGFSIGSNDKVLQQIPELGLKSLTLSVLAVIGSVFLGWIFWRFIMKERNASSSK